jgi:hypothetical protein
MKNKQNGCVKNYMSEKKIWILTVISTTITLNWSMSSGRLKISYRKFQLFTKLKFNNYGQKIYFYLAGTRRNIHYMYLFYCIKCTIPPVTDTYYDCQWCVCPLNQASWINWSHFKPVFERRLILKLGHLLSWLRTGIPQSLQADHNSHYSVVTLFIQCQDSEVSIEIGYRAGRLKG